MALRHTNLTSGKVGRSTGNLADLGHDRPDSRDVSSDVLGPPRLLYGPLVDYVLSYHNATIIREGPAPDPKVGTVCGIGALSMSFDA